MTRPVQQAASRAGDHPVLAVGARLGYAASGVLHLLLAWVTVQLAWTSGGEQADQPAQADQQGALAQVADNGVGVVLLWVLLAGFVLLALWQATEAIAHGSAGDRVKAAAKALTYAVLAATTVQVLTGSAGSGGSGGPGQATSTLLGSAGGRLLVGAVGLGVVAVGGYHVVKGWRESFLDDLRAHPGRWVRRAGRIGYVGKGAALAVVGVLLVVAAVRSDPEQAEGLDAALHALAGLPFGAVLLTLVALGFAGYGVYALAGRARHAAV
jgi:fumarate reductase subunit D